MKDSDFLLKMLESLQTDAYDFGAFVELNGLDAKNLKHPFFERN